MPAVSGGSWAALGVDDPVPGDEVAVGELARTLLRWGEEAAEQELAVRRLHSSLASGPWSGEAAAAFAVRLAPLPDRLDMVSSSFQRAGEALRIFARQIAVANDDAARLRVSAGCGTR